MGRSASVVATYPVRSVRLGRTRTCVGGHRNDPSRAGVVASGTICCGAYRRAELLVGSSTTLDPMDVGRGEAQKRRPISSATISTLERCSPSSALPAALLEAAAHHDAHALGEAERDVLGQVAPAHDVEERGRLVPFLGGPVLPAPIDGHAELSGCLTLSGVTDLGFPVRFPVIVVALVMVLLLLLLASFLANDAAASFDERRSPPAAKRGQVPERGALGPNKKFWRVRPQGELQRSGSRQKLL